MKYLPYALFAILILLRVVTPTMELEQLDTPQVITLENEPDKAENRLVFNSKDNKYYSIEDFNQLSTEELEMLNGIGPKTAQAIVEYIKTNGPITNFDELLKIKGIGEKKLMQILEHSQ